MDTLRNIEEQFRNNKSDNVVLSQLLIDVEQLIASQEDENIMLLTTALRKSIITQKITNNSYVSNTWSLCVKKHTPKERVEDLKQ